jgi:hypothetical protein
MNIQQIKEIIKRELPAIMQEDPEIRRFILRLSRQHFADKAETESRFDRLLDELRRIREEESKKWAEQTKKWEEQDRRWHEMQAELAKKWEEQERRWAEQAKKWEEQDRRWNEIQAELARKWEEQERRWEEQMAENRRLYEAIQAVSRKHDSTIGALGARWGLFAEQSFRNALKGILEEYFDVEVLNVTEYDEEGEVFGRPDQVELDVIVKDGILILGEIKSSMSKSDMYAFERKVRFYEKRHGRKASRIIVISPMVDDRAREVAQMLGIQVYSYAEDAGPAFSDVGTMGQS